MVSSTCNDAMSSSFDRMQYLCKNSMQFKFGGTGERQIACDAMNQPYKSHANAMIIRNMMYVQNFMLEKRKKLCRCSVSSITSRKGFKFVVLVDTVPIWTCILVMSEKRYQHLNPHMWKEEPHRRNVSNRLYECPHRLHSNFLWPSWALW